MIDRWIAILMMLQANGRVSNAEIAMVDGPIGGLERIRKLEERSHQRLRCALDPQAARSCWPMCWCGRNARGER
jgi:DNA-binding Lrp family transcriptional regulator